MARVPASEATRKRLIEPNGPANMVEFGTVAKPDEFKALYEMSAYHHVRSNVRYPAIILPHGVNDSRVAVWQSSKMAAALQASNSSSVVLLNLDYDAGHGRGSSTSQRLGSARASQVIDVMVGRGRFELPTNGLKVRCSTG